MTPRLGGPAQVVLIGDREHPLHTARVAARHLRTWNQLQALSDWRVLIVTESAPFASIDEVRDVASKARAGRTVMLVAGDQPAHGLVPWLRLLPHARVVSPRELDAELRRIEAAVRRPEVPSSQLVATTRVDDARARSVLAALRRAHAGERRRPHIHPLRIVALPNRSVKSYPATRTDSSVDPPGADCGRARPLAGASSKAPAGPAGALRP